MTLTPSQTGLLEALVAVSTTKEREGLLKQHDHSCEKLAEAEPATAARLAAEKALSDAESALSEAQAAERAALTACAASYTPKLEVGWMDAGILERFDTTYAKERAGYLSGERSLEDLLSKMNKHVVMGYDERRVINEFYTAYRNTEQDHHRYANWLFLNGAGDEITGVAGRTYEFSLRQAKALVDWACGYWKEEHTKSSRRVTYHGERHEAVIDEERIQIGCQTLARAEITRIAALMGWGGLPKQEGPDVQPPAPRKRAAPRKRTTTRNRKEAVTA